MLGMMGWPKSHFVFHNDPENPNDIWPTLYVHRIYIYLHVYIYELQITIYFILYIIK